MGPQQSLRANPHLTDAYHGPLLSPAECDAFVADATTGAEFGPGVAEGAAGARTAGVILLDAMAHIDTMQRVADVVSEANRRLFEFDIVGLIDEDPPQLVRYDAPTGETGGGHYDWHLDTGGPVSTRKVSYSLQLSDPASYDGGILEIGLPRPEPQTRAQGSIVVFPSYLPHRVRPVERGTRHALVGWVHGPSFR